MRRSKFKKPCKVLVFNGAHTLIAIIRSLHSVADLGQLNLQAISNCCTGKYISSGGFYFRHLHPDVLIDIDDLDNLTIEEYDRLCGVKREYYSVRVMKHKRDKLVERRNKALEAFKEKERKE